MNYRKKIEQYMNEQISVGGKLLKELLASLDTLIEKINNDASIGDEVWGKSLNYLALDNNKLIGFLSIRYDLPQSLVDIYGHIGYGVRPTERRKGYAKEMLKSALPFCREINLENVLITCIDDNIGSEKTIIANGGIYDSTVYEPDEKVNLKRYWINI
jgi:predicted acetyltransferase